MATMDWNDTAYAYLVEVLVVSQTNVDIVLGTLQGFVLSGASITENYNSDSRSQAKITTIVAENESDGYIDQARLRILLSIPSRGYSQELITGYVTDISEKTEHGYTQRDYSIEGTMWGLLNHKIDAPITIGKGASMVTVWRALLQSQTKMQFTAEKAQDHIFSQTIIYEAGSDLSTVLFEISSGYSRMDNTGHGVVELVKYIAPSKRQPDKTIDVSDVRGLLMYPLEKKSTQWEAPGRAIVTATVSKTDRNGNTTQEVLVGTYDAPSSHHTSLAKRGWLRARADSYTGLSENPTKDALKTEARRNWENSQSKYRSWTASSTFANYHAGDVIELIFGIDDSKKDGESSVKVLIENVQTNLENFTQDLTMKEV